MTRGAGTLAAALALVTLPAAAKVSEEEAARLGGELTPVGAERAGNAEGTIPAWTGGIEAPPPGWTREPTTISSSRVSAFSLRAWPIPSP